MNIFEFIKQRVSILDVAQEYASLKKAGQYLKGVCPFHYEKTPSFTISPEKNIFYCFGCQAGGDVITFITRIEHCSSLEAAQFLAERYNLELPASTEASQQINKNKKQHYDVCATVATWFHEQCIQSPAITRYYADRGITLASIKQFNLGYFPGGSRSINRLITYVQRHNYLAHDLIEAGILNEGKGSLYSSFEERIIFPITDSLGRICGFGGRIYKKSDERAKYYNSPENIFFAKGSLLFGLHLAKPFIQKKECAFLVEGYFDAIAMAQHNYPHTVATLGTACTIDHLQYLARHTSVLYVLFDSDQAGYNAIYRLAELCWQVNLELYIIELPRGEDPASYLKKQSTIDIYIQQKIDIFEFLLKQQANEFSKKDLAKKLSIVEKLLLTIAKLEDPLKKHILLTRVSDSFGIPFSILEQKITSPEKKYSIATSPSKNLSGRPLYENSLKEISILEKKLFSVIINNMQTIQKEHMLYVATYICEPLRTIMQKLVEYLNSAAIPTLANLMNTVSEQEKMILSALIFECQAYEHIENFEYLFSHFQKNNWRQCIVDTKKSIAQAKKEKNYDKVQNILQHFEMLKKQLLR